MNKIWLSVISVVILAGIILIDVSHFSKRIRDSPSPTWKTLDIASDLESGETLIEDLPPFMCHLKLVKYKSIEPDSVLTIVGEDNAEVYRAPIVESWKPLNIKYDHNFTLDQSGRYFIEVAGVSGFTIEIMYLTMRLPGPGRKTYPCRAFLPIGILFVILGAVIVSIDLIHHKGRAETD